MQNEDQHQGQRSKATGYFVSPRISEKKSAEALLRPLRAYTPKGVTPQGLLITAFLSLSLSF